MRFLLSLVFLLPIPLPAQDAPTASRVLEHLWRSASGASPLRPTLLAILDRAGVPVIAYRPARGDTLALQTTVPAFLPSEEVWTVGNWALACVRGRIRGYRTTFSVTCTATGARTLRDLARLSGIRSRETRARRSPQGSYSARQRSPCTKSDDASSRRTNGSGTWCQVPVREVAATLRTLRPVP